MTARFHLAWLIWCREQGYVLEEDRAGMSNWLEGDPDKMVWQDVATRDSLLQMADEILELL